MTFLKTALTFSLVAFFSIFLSFYQLGSFSIKAGDETLHFLATQSMWHTGRWWSPELYGVPYFNKPPLKMWLTFLPYSLLGETSYAYRFWDASFGVLTVLFVSYLAGRIFKSNFYALLSALVLLSSKAYLTVHGVREGVQDSALVFFVTLVVGLFYLWFIEKPKIDNQSFEISSENNSGMPPDNLGQQVSSNRLSKVITLGVLIGAASLIKSVGAWISIIIIGSYCFVRLLESLYRVYVQKNQTTQICWLLSIREIAILGFLVILIPSFYFVPHCLNNSTACRIFFNNEIINRVTVGYHNSNNRFYYFKEFYYLKNLLPPYFVIFSLLFSLVLLGMMLLREKNVSEQEENASTQKKQLFYLLCWAVLPVIFYNFIPSRLVWYIYPSLPGWCLICCFTFKELSSLVKRLYTKTSASKKILSAFTASLLVVFSAETLEQNYKVAKTILQHKRQVPLDLLTEKLIKKGILGDKKVIIISPTKLSNREILYTNKYQQLNLEIEQLPDYFSKGSIQDKTVQDKINREYAKGQLDQQTTSPNTELENIKKSILIFAPDQLEKVINKLLIIAPEVLSSFEYDLLPPNPKRNGWLWVLSFIEEGKGTLFPSSLSYRGNKLKRIVLSGLLVNRKFGNKEVVCTKAGIRRAVIKLPGDFARKRFDTVITLTLAKDRKSAPPLEIFLNERKIGNISSLSRSLSNYKYLTSKDFWETDFNYLVIAAAQKGKEESENQGFCLSILNLNYEILPEKGF